MTVPESAKIVLTAHPARDAKDDGIAASVETILTGFGLLLSAVVVCWFRFFLQLRGEWQINPQYSYGFAVPFLTAVLFWRRWPGHSRSNAPATTRWVGLLEVFLLFLLLPLWLILEANPEWRLLYWSSALQVLALSGCMLYRLGGFAWVRYFAPPLLFALVAVPWPIGMERAAIQGLMRFVAGLTVDFADGLGIAAVQHGNLIEVSTGIVGIDEACSGVRSLQSGLMLSLFLGEMHRFCWVKRLWLVVGSLVFVLSANLARTTFLVWAASHRGIAQMEAWHDPAGVSVMVIVLTSLLGLAHLLRPANPHLASNPVSQPIRLPLAPRWIGVLTLIWLVSSAVAVEAWYRFHETKLVATTHWNVAWPTQNPSFKKTSLPENSLAILRCSQSEAASWEDEQSNQWSAFLLRWAPGKNSVQLAKGHRPDICFPAAGAQMVGDFGQRTFSVGELQMTFRHQTFEMTDKLAHVFYCLWADRASHDPTPLLEDGSQASRFQAVAVGERNLGQQVLEIVIAGPRSHDEAVVAMTDALPCLIQIEREK